MLGQKTVHQRWSPICVCVPSRVVVVAVDYSTYILGNPYDSCSFIFFELFFLFIMFTFCSRYRNLLVTERFNPHDAQTGHR